MMVVIKNYIFVELVLFNKFDPVIVSYVVYRKERMSLFWIFIYL